MILCANPKAQYLAHKAAIDAAIQRVLENGRYVLGPEVAAFEAEFAAYIGAGHAIGVGQRNRRDRDRIRRRWASARATR